MKLPVFLCMLLVAKISTSQQTRLVVPIGHKAGLTEVQFSRDGKLILTGDESGAAVLWQVATGKELMSWGKNQVSGGIPMMDLSKAIFSPDGKCVLSRSAVWNLMTGERQCQLKLNSAPICASYSLDSKYIATAQFSMTGSGLVTLCDASTGEIKKTFSGHSGIINSVVFSADNMNLLTAGADGSVKLWDINTQKVIKTFKDKGDDDEEEISSATFSPDGKYVLAIMENMVKLWRTADAKLIASLEHNNEVKKAVFSPACITDPAGGKYIATIAGEGKPQIWFSENGLPVTETEFDLGVNDDICFSPDGKLLAVVSTKSINFVEIPSGKSAFVLNEFGNTDFHSGLSANSSITAITFSVDGKRIATASDDKTIKVWQLENQLLITDLRGNNGGFQINKFLTNDSLLLTRGEKELVWNINTGQAKEKPITKEQVEFLLKSSDDKIFLQLGDESVKIMDANTGKIVSTIVGYESPGPTTKGFFTPDNKYLIIDDGEGRVIQWLVATGKIVKEYKGTLFYPYLLNPTSSYVSSNKCLIMTSDNHYSVLDIPSGKIVTVLKTKIAEDFADILSNAVFSPTTTSYPAGGKYVLTFSSLGKRVIIWDANTGETVSAFTTPDNITDAIFSSDDRSVITASGGLEKWDLKTGRQLITFFPVDYNYEKTEKFGFDNEYTQISQIDSSEYINITPKGFYQCSPNGASLLHYVKGLQVVGVEQLDVKYNRPDRVLESIGNTDTALIKSYRKAWEKRIKKLGIDTTAFRDGYSVPEADFINRDVIEYEQKNGTLKLTIKGNDSTYKLDRFNVWVNEVPIYGQRGISIRTKNSNNFDTTISIKLSQDQNRIETSIINVNGTESYRMPLLINYTSANRQKEITRFIGIGIDKFADNNNNLQYCTKDIRDLALALKAKYKDNIIIDTLFNENVTVGNVKALKQKLLQTTVNDKVIISYSGHGVLNKEFDYYLSTYPINFNKPEENGLPYDELENLLDSIPARKKLMMIDACHSGEVDKDELETINKTAESIGLIKDKRGLKPIRSKTVGLNNSFELMQNLFVNVGKSTGATIISAAAGTQFAQERKEFKNGVFTYSILEAMDKYSTLKISELKKIVGQRVEQITKGLQKPTSRNKTIAVDWNVW